MINFLMTDNRKLNPQATVINHSNISIDNFGFNTQVNDKFPDDSSYSGDSQGYRHKWS